MSMSIVSGWRRGGGASKASPEPSRESVEARHGGFADWSEDRLRLDFSVEAPANAGLIVAPVERCQEQGNRGHM